jgi:nicotinamide mononucleotide adenylyltransferase
MINPTQIGQRIAEAIINEAGPCFYPGRFKPPHKGHYEAAKELASRDYIQMVYILISKKVVDGITPEDSLMVWNTFLKAEPNPKISVSIATTDSPVTAIINYLNKNTTVKTVYVAISDDETDDIDYGKALQENYGDKVKLIPIHDKSGIISSPHVRNILADGNYEEFVESIPEAAYNRGAAPKIFKMLATKVRKNGSEQA